VVVADAVWVVGAVEAHAKSGCIRDTYKRVQFFALQVANFFVFRLDNETEA
jgi:hypothetical protein